MQRTALLSFCLSCFCFTLTFTTEAPGVRSAAAILCIVATVIFQTRAAPGWSWLLGCCSMFGCYWWMTWVSPVFFKVAAIWGYPICLAFCAYEGSKFFLAHLLFALLRPYLRMISLAAGWCTIELLFPHIIPWSWANLFIDATPLVLSAGVIGTSLFTLLLFVCCTPVATATRSTGATAAASVTALLVLSWWQNHQIITRETTAPSLRLGMVQSNLDPQRDFVPEKRISNLIKQRRLSEKLLSAQPMVLVWPEATVHFDYPANLRMLAPSSPAHPYPQSPSPVLFGTQTLLPEKNAHGDALYYLSALMVAGDGHVLGRYDKHRLLPFAETIPFGAWFPGLRRLLPAGYELKSGDGSTLLPAPGISGGSLVLSICYEDLFASTFSEAPSPSLLLSLTNDARFLDSSASRQHELLSRLRGVEQGRYFARITNNGVTVVISPRGTEVFRLPSFQEAIGVAEIPLL